MSIRSTIRIAVQTQEEGECRQALETLQLGNVMVYNSCSGRRRKRRKKRRRKRKSRIGEGRDGKREAMGQRPVGGRAPWE